MRPRCGNCPSASTSARTQLASCPCKSRCANPPCDPAAGLWTPLPAIPFLCPSLKPVSRKRSMFAWPAGSFRVSHLCCGRFVEGGASRPARRVQADLGEGHEPACHLRPQHVCLHLAHSSMYGTTCPYLPFGCRPSRQCVVSMRRTSRPFLTYTAPPARRGRRIHAVRELWQGNRPARTKMPLCWQNAREMRSRVPCRGKIPPRCVPGRPSVAIFSPHASPRGLRTGKSPVRGKIRTPCIRKRAGFGKICAPCIRKALQTAVWEYTARRSCHEGATFAAQAPRIMHGARILPSSDA